jgi:hypothetical protein
MGDQRRRKEENRKMRKKWGGRGWRGVIKNTLYKAAPGPKIIDKEKETQKE